MTRPKNIVACLDIKDGKVVKGVNFAGIKEVGDVLERARLYAQMGADELCFYDISASVEGRTLFTQMLESMVKAVNTPVSAAGGVKTTEDFARVLDTGVVKVSMNSGALLNPSLVEKCARKFGQDKVVVAVDVARVGDEWHCFNQAGAHDTGIEALGWLKQCESMGAGEVVVNSIDTDGVRQGYDLGLLEAVCNSLSIPVVASGGAGSVEHILSLFAKVPKCAAALGASIFHYDLVNIEELKQRMAGEGIPLDCEDNMDISTLRFNDKGLIPAIVVDADTNQVLMLAYMNEESLRLTMEKGLTTFYSRSRQRLWTKGETSGHYQHVLSITPDCDGDTLKVLVRKEGPSCHLNTETCFDREPIFEGEGSAFSMTGLMELLQGRKQNPPPGSYTSYLFEKGLDKILKKVGEETTEVIIAAKAEDKKETIYEIADLAYHVMVLMVEAGISLQDIAQELASRHVVDKKVKQEKMT